MLSKELWYPRIQIAGDRSLLITFGAGISRKHHQDVVRLCRLLQEEPPPSLCTLHPAYSSVLVTFDPLQIPPAEFEALIEQLVNRIDSVEVPESRHIEIPVCYGDAFGPDLPDVALHARMNEEEVVRVHSSVEYLVYFLGFSPGFPYLGDLPKEIATPRLSTPRTNVPAGSVAIGGSQTGIYSISSPGGWRIIGRTPLRLFRPDDDPPALLRMGDRIHFRPIAKEEFLLLSTG